MNRDLFANVHPVIAQALRPFVTPSACHGTQDQLWRASVKAGPRRFNGDRITAMGGLDELDGEPQPDQTAEDARTWAARNVG